MTRKRCSFIALSGASQAGVRELGVSGGLFLALGTHELFEPRFDLAEQGWKPYLRASPAPELSRSTPIQIPFVTMEVDPSQREMCR